MDIQSLTYFFMQYGAIFIFVVVLLEYLNLPGFPAGIIMPLAGVLAARGEINFFLTIAISVGAGLLGSWMLYLLGRVSGGIFLKSYLKRFPKQEAVIEKNLEFLRKKGAFGVFISKLIPMVRTIISIPAGMIKMDFITYSISSALGIFIWNFVLIGAGYFMGDAALSLFS